MVHIRFSKMLEHMKDGNRIEMPKCTQITGQQIGLIKTHIRQVPLFSQCPGDSKWFCTNINPNDPCKRRETFGNNQWQKSRGTPGIQKALTNLQFTDPTIQRSKNIDRGVAVWSSVMVSLQQSMIAL